LQDVDSAIVMEHWKGDTDLLELVRRIISTADQMLGSGLWKKLTSMFGDKRR
jgi:hypothetical protein